LRQLLLAIFSLLAAGYLVNQVRKPARWVVAEAYRKGNSTRVMVALVKQ
jgi:hypothetical protein